MEANENAEFYISEKELRISGPADFVKDMVTSHKYVVDRFAEKLKKALLDGNDDTAKSLSSKDSSIALPTGPISEYTDFEEIKGSSNFLEKNANVVGIDGSKIQILTTIPGNSLPSRMINLILIYLYIKVKVSSIERVSFAELRNFCEMHGELDGPHFAAYLKKNKKWFLLDGPTKNLTAKITVPGMKEAERLLDLMNK